ncbi:hypothetical protein LY90DRAFT_512321 [Neocallimastix californiae]|uniref:Uncharacterized protein n=1 Tax=Neocallimastix californiae TaxID=1754190 RepID=A0A1Y2BB44_9FUNG|nr:hypothetical protein LY90DRAFT_512321 [Neocallimastix californiae]|eukprot:ORY32033.1 hypothetical protein LY90DRAFT_512321 [Neocallimastix californiae]
MSNKDNFGNILNLPIINIANRYGKKYIFTILQLICANQLGIIFNDNSSNGYNSSENFIDHTSVFSNFSSRPILSKSLDLIFQINGKFPSKINYYKGKCLYQYFERSIENEWIALFKLKDSKRNNKTLMHFLCEGDRLSAIQFLVEHGANINDYNPIEKTQITEKGFSKTNSNTLNEYTNFKIYGNMCVNSKSLFSFLFGYIYINCECYFPSGFIKGNRIDKCLSLKNFIKENLDKSEQYIINEAEKIAEYLYDQGAEIILEENKKLYLISEIIYKLLKRGRKKESEKNKEEIKVVVTENIENKESEKSISSLELRTKQNNDDQSLKESKESSSTLQISKNKEEKSLQSNSNNKDRSEMEKPSTSKDNEISENTNQSKNSQVSSNDDQDKNERCLNNLPYDNTHPVKANLNLPVSLWEDIRELSILSGKSVDTICWELLSSNLEEKLKEARGFGNNENKKGKEK